MSIPPHSSLFACPDCSTYLTSLAHCAACGRDFGEELGTPLLFPETDRTITFKAPPSAFDPGRIPVETFFRYPSRSGQPKSGAYHLDRAHADVLEDLPGGSLMIEVGCGGGQMRKWTAERGLEYLGTDVSKERVHDWLREYGGADVLCDAHALPFRDGVADVVYSAAVWEHLAFPQLAAVEAARVLKPGGYHLGSASFLEPWHDSSYYHMSPFGIYMTLTLAGLQPVYIWPEVEWPGFKAILAMGNKVTRPLTWLGRMLNMWYLAPKAVQAAIRNRRMPVRGDLLHPRATVSGAIAWIARKP